MDELEFYDGAWTGQEIDAGIGLTGTLAESIGPVVDGNQCAVSVRENVFVFVKNSTITGIADGAYLAAKTIPANTALDATYFKTLYKGAVNATNIQSKDVTISAPAATWVTVPVNTLLGTYASNIVAVQAWNPDNASSSCFILWKASGWSNITIIRINTNSTNLTIINTADDALKLKIWYRPLTT